MTDRLPDYYETVGEDVIAFYDQGDDGVWVDLGSGPGGRAMIGGGLGSTYPQWARQEFMRRRRESLKSPEQAGAFAETRHPETFRRLATEAGLPSFQVVG